MNKIILSVFLLLAAGLAVAAPATPQLQSASQNVQQYIDAANAGGDKSVEMLCYVFGGDVVGHSGLTCSGNMGGTTMTSALLALLSSALLGLGTLMFGYNVMKGITGTMIDGEFMGKKMHSMWMPIRTAIGVITLIPVPLAGMATMMQIIGIAVTGVGIGIANLGYKQSVELFVNGQTTLVATPPTPAATELAWHVLSLEACRTATNAAVDARMAQLNAQVQVGAATPDDVAAYDSYHIGIFPGTSTSGKPNYEMRTASSPNNSCGGIYLDVKTNGGITGVGGNVVNVDTGHGFIDTTTGGVFSAAAKDSITKSHQAAIIALAATVMPAAQKIGQNAAYQVETDKTGMVDPLAGMTPEARTAMIIQAVQDGANGYEQTVRMAIGAIQGVSVITGGAVGSNEHGALVQEFTRTANQDGWITAGFFYTTMSRIDGATSNAARAMWQEDKQVDQQFSNHEASDPGMKARLKAADMIVKAEKAYGKIPGSMSNNLIAGAAGGAGTAAQQINTATVPGINGD